MEVAFNASEKPFQDFQTIFFHWPVDLPHGAFKEEWKQLLNHQPASLPTNTAQFAESLNKQLI